MSSDADRPLRPGNIEFSPHLARHPRVVLGGTRPGALIESPEHEQVGVLQSRLQGAPNRQPRVASESRSHNRTGHQRFKKRPIVAARQRRKIFGGIYQLMTKARRRLARRLAPKAWAAGLRRGRREPLDRLDMRDNETAKRHGLRGEQLREWTETGFQPTGKSAQVVARIGQGSLEAGKTRRRARPENRAFELPSEIAKNCGDKPTRSERVLQRGEQLHRRQPAVGELEDKAQEDAGRRPVERHTRGIVNLDVPSPQFGRYPARQLAVRGHEGRGGPRRLEFAPKQQRNRHSLALRARAVVAAEAVERICRLRRQAAPGIGGRGRPHRLAEESNSPRTRTLFHLAALASFFRRAKRRREQREVCGRTFTTDRGRSVRGTPIRYFGRGQA